MSNYDYKQNYKRNLPHFQPPGATIFVTIRLSGSIPIDILKQLKAESEFFEHRIQETISPNRHQLLLYEEKKRHFGKLDKYLDQTSQDPHWLKQPEVASIVRGSLHYLDGRVYELDTYCIMSNHVHLVITPMKIKENNYHPLQKIMHSFKRYTAFEGNKVLGRNGPFWHHESYDHVVRDQQELKRIVAYVLNNPVNAGLVATWKDWSWSYLKD